MPSRCYLIHPLAAAFLVASACSVHAQYPAPYGAYPTGYPARPPIYIPEPGHPADTPFPAEPGNPPRQAAAPPVQGYWAPEQERPHAAATPLWPYTQPYRSQPVYARPQATSTALAHALLAPQNAVRTAVADQPLHWSAKLAGVAQQWADHLVATGRFEHKLGDRYGENLYEMTGGTATPSQVVAAWADEAQNYDLRTNVCSGVCGHYTQIVWSTTRAVGCAVASGADRQVWVCEYDPAGNWVGYRPF